LPQWAEVTPFVMTTPWQFRLPGPPALASEQYVRDFNEVKRLGAKTSVDRTAAQAEIARYWYESSPAGWSRIARVVAAQRGSDIRDSARLLALVNAAIADGYIAGADTRYLYDFWRPVTAIRTADTDGNDATRSMAPGSRSSTLHPCRTTPRRTAWRAGRRPPSWRDSSAPIRSPSR
jgi:hypothetical protein